MTTRRRSTHPFFLTFLISFLITVFTILFITSFIYLAGANAVKDEVIERNLSILQINGEILDDAFTDIKIMVARIAASPEIHEFMIAPRGSSIRENVLDILFFYNSLSYQYYNDRFVHNIWVYNERLDAVITPNDVFLGLREAYENVPDPRLHFGDLDYELWLDTGLRAPIAEEFLAATRVRDTRGWYNALPFLRRLPGNTGKSDGALLVMMNEAEILANLEPLQLGETGWLTLIRDDGTIISRIGTVFEDELSTIMTSNRTGVYEYLFDAHRHLVFSMELSSHPLNFMAAVPMGEILAPVTRIRNISIILLLTALGAGILAALYFTRRFSRPLEAMLFAMRGRWKPDAAGRGRALERLQAGGQDVLEHTDRLESSVRTYGPVLIESLLHILFFGDASGGAELDRWIRAAGLSFRGKVLRVVAIKAAGFDGILYEEERRDLDALMDRMALVVKESSRGYGTRIGLNRFGILLVKEDSARDTVVVELERISAEVLGDIPVSLLYGVGGGRREPTEVHMAYSEAIQALEYGEANTESALLFFEDLPDLNEYFRYPIEMERQIMGFVRRGESEKTAKILDEVIHANTVDRILSPEMSTCLLESIRGTYVRLSGSFLESPDIPSIDRESGLRTQVESLKTRFVALADLVQRRKQESFPLMDSILRYLEEQYAENSMSLSEIAGAFRISEGYLSRIFKEYTGLNFYLYVAKLRMEKACRLLETEKIAIDKICGAVGYGSARVFRRAFKRYIGMTPSQYRSEHFTGENTMKAP